MSWKNTGDEHTFLKVNVNARMMVHNKSTVVTALVVMPKYKLELAKTQKLMMSRRLELALTCLYENGEAEFRAVLGNPRQWSFSMHTKLMYKYTVLYVLESGQVVDEHSHFVHSSCSEHSFFYKGALGRLDLNPIARGPGNKKGREPPRSKRNDEFRKKMRTSPRELC